MSGNLPQEKGKYERTLVWHRTLLFIYMHIASVYGLFLLLDGRMKFLTIIFEFLVAAAGVLGFTAGAHRLWSHKAYKATWQFRLILAIMQSSSFQGHIYAWVRHHRVHHKFTDTDADPYNSKRGFFFSHIGWLCVSKHPDVNEKGRQVDMRDLQADPIVMWQKKFSRILIPFFAWVVPVTVPIYLWKEDPWIAWYSRVLFLCIAHNATFLVNSAAHIWGTKPYDKDISPAENASVGIVAFGEGWHNYHHTFPWDYKGSELGKWQVNLTAGLIDLMAKIGWTYDLRTVPLEMIQTRAERTGDGSLKDPDDPNHHMNNIWGWDDTDMKRMDKIRARVLYPKKN